MESGMLSSAHHGRVFLSALAVFCLAICAVGQQSAAEPVGQTASPTVQTRDPFPSAAQPVTNNAAASANGQSTSPQAAPGQISPIQPLSSQDAAKETANLPLGPLTLGPGDLIEVNVFNVPELQTKARLSSSGDVYLPLIDYVHLQGLTQEEAQTVLEKRLEEGGFVRSPHVTIFVDDAASQGITILGEVPRSGIYPEVADHKLYTMISAAGGFSLSAAHRVDIIRRGQPEAIHIMLPRNLADDVNANVEVLPGDTITVPRAPVVYVVGDVGRPSGLMVDNGRLTVLQALALAGGANHTAKLGDTRIIRKTPAGMTETKVQLKKMLEAKSPDVTLQADDILFVPISGLKVAAARTAEAAVSAATALTIYAVHP
jgi:polysaccharide biosynthesis/export protein